MADYYIKISNEIPVGEDEGLWFKVNSDELEEGDEFFVIRRNDYNELKESLTILEGELGNNEILTNAVNNAMEHISTVPPLSTGALRVVDSNDNSKIFTYSNIQDLKTKLDTIEEGSNKIIVDDSLKNTSTNPVENRVVNNALSTKANQSDFESSINTLQTGLNGKSPTSHVHTGWTYKQLNDYSVLYYNPAIKLCYFRYYRSSYTFSKTSTFTLHSGLIPSAYRPHGDVVLPFFHMHLRGYIDQDTGNFQIASDTKASYAINTSAVWSYR